MTTTKNPVTTTPVIFQGARLVGYTRHPRMSQETTAFDADVHIDGTKVGTLSNAGHGGADTFYPDSRDGHAAFQRAQEAFSGIHDSTFDLTHDLAESLATIAEIAAELGARTVIPGRTPEDLVSDSTRIPVYQLGKSPKEPVEPLLPQIMSALDTPNALYPVKENGGYWMNVATR